MMWNKWKESQWILGSSGYHDGNDPQFHIESVGKEFSQEHMDARERERERERERDVVVLDIESIKGASLVVQWLRLHSLILEVHI